MRQIIDFLINLFKKYVPEYRVVKETRAVKETADGQNLTLQTFYYPQVKKKKRGHWERIGIVTLKPDIEYSNRYEYCHDYGCYDGEYDSEELASKAIECYTYQEDYRGETIRMAMLIHWGFEHEMPEVVYYISNEDRYSYYTHAYKTHDEVIEEINSMKPQVINIETIEK